MRDKIKDECDKYKGRRLSMPKGRESSSIILAWIPAVIMK